MLKKLLKLGAGILGTASLLAGLALLDLHRRADAALKMHRVRLAADIADQRSRHRPPAILAELDFTLPVLECMPCPQPVWNGLSGRCAAYEDGHAAQDAALRRLEESGCRVDRIRRDGVEARVTGVALTAHQWREGGTRAAYNRRNQRSVALDSMKDVLTFSEYESHDLRWLSMALETLWSDRPSPADILTGEYILDRVEVFNVLETGSDPRGFLLAVPEWRDLFSRDLLWVRVLNQLADDHRIAMALCRTLPPDWATLVPMSTRPPGRPALTTSRLFDEMWIVRKDEEVDRLYWIRARTCIASALYSQDLGASPESYFDLVPSYLPEVPIDPWTGLPYALEDGALPWQSIEGFYM